MAITEKTILRIGNKEIENNKILQTALKQKGYYKGVIDGSFGVMTKTAVMNYQKAKKLVQDGIAGPITNKNLGILHSTPTPTKTKTSVSTQIYSVPSYKYEKQDTDYTCGPSSSVMALSELGINVTEYQMAKVEETTKNGTGHATLMAGIKKACANAGVTVQVSEANFSTVGWQGLANYIKDPKVSVIVHGVCAGWKYYTSYKGGHYVFPIKIDMASKVITIADPTKGVITYTFDEFKKGLDLLSQPSLIVIKK